MPKQRDKTLTASQITIIILVIIIGLLLIILREQWATGTDTAVIDGQSIGFAERPRVREEPIKNLHDEISRFFSHIATSLTPGANDSSIYVIELAQSQKTLEQVIASLPRRNDADKDWRGEPDQHWFMEGETIKQRLEEIARDYHVNFIWWLSRDYIVKSPFNIDDTFVGAVNQVAETVKHDFMVPVHAYYCFPQNTLVVTEAEDVKAMTHDCPPVERLLYPNQQQPQAPKAQAKTNLQLKH
ncbi:hypothetical protein CWI84_11255 [Idiomarina tyrosinivorans]|uniref:Toxin co-regulated pilus biosynthesis protein Q C-terminal domain-containing protein n=1 Tax=Idiomarina tyrosinivorans TaxID=1445662 RepID=A0A432ZG94_9GAMM|nr:TcpQ domain-containing protein [Idiomarina tyrosinivorans]RUO76923.1 hypothetical protein CWI84_11255 [Idiomarina tyrosinivorans]